MNLKNLAVALVLGSLMLMGCSKRVALKAGARPGETTKVNPANPNVAPKPNPIPKTNTPPAAASAKSAKAVLAGNWFGPCTNKAYIVPGGIESQSFKVIEVITADKINRITRYFSETDCKITGSAYDTDADVWGYSLVKDGVVDAAAMQINYTSYPDGSLAADFADNSDTIKIATSYDEDDYDTFTLNYSDVNDITYSRLQ